ncbi:hypothetical protein K501DRAFT_297560 [Backusella circina FSU 941]|nr:hypothetical protein K501DRAFT_297560 [Backusella circina FSU 941]
MLMPQKTFPYDRVSDWFPGHMAVLYSNVSIQSISYRRPRLIVYNKADLAHSTTAAITTNAFTKHEPHTPVIFTSSKLVDPIPQVTFMVMGMPNVGKSSLINSLRRVGVGNGKATQTGAQPGITRTVIGTVKVLEDPTVYLVDTPGDMVPHITDEQVIADYLLYRLNGFHAYECMARRVGAAVKVGELDLTMASKFFLKHYRTGKLGRYTSDDLSPTSIDTFFEHLKMFSATDKLMDGSNRQQEKKLDKLGQRKQSRKASEDQS